MTGPTSVYPDRYAVKIVYQLGKAINLFRFKTGNFLLLEFRLGSIDEHYLFNSRGSIKSKFIVGLDNKKVCAGGNDFPAYRFWSFTINLNITEQKSFHISRIKP
ncbi:hypothetical protein SY88_13500 [Clostridiales bacterium PH28_bin88]|nr:hypothetical protein SY88_13500 [Clostridiales bacterium PH28_bin88]